MKLLSLGMFFSPRALVGELVRRPAGKSAVPGFAAIAFLMLLAVDGYREPAYARQTRMIIDGSLRPEGVSNPSAIRVRLLHQDGTVARSVGLYDPRGYKFGIRLSAQDGFVENEKLLFRVIASAQDSFIARFAGPPPVYKGSEVPGQAQTAYVLLFRNSLPTVYRWLPDTEIDEGQLIRYRFVAIDRDADTARFSMRNAPPGAAIDNITGMFSWRPTYDQSGKYRITFFISDGYDTDSTHAATIIVRNVNRAPAFVAPLQDTVIHEGETLRASALAVDPDEDHLTYRAVGAPPGFHVDSTTASITWTPTYDQQGEYALRMIVTDGLAYDTSRVTHLTVLNVDRPPVFVRVVGDTVIREQDSLSFSFLAVDPDGDRVSYSLRNGPPGMMMTSSGHIGWRPSFTQAGNYRYAVEARGSDSGSTFFGNIRVLNNNRSPVPGLLYGPFDRDTIRLALAIPVHFIWFRSFDPDSDDTLRYRIHLWGPQLDTVMYSGTDTVLAANIKPRLLPLSRYSWNVVTDDGHTNVLSTDTYSFRTSAGIIGSTELLSQIPKSYYLEQSFPDPLNPMITIRYALPERSYVKLAIYTVLGETLLILVSGEKDAGVYDVTFDASEFTSGAYTFRLDAHPRVGNQFKDFVNTKKMFIVR